MKANAGKQFRSPVPGVFTPRSFGWNISHRRNVSPLRHFGSDAGPQTCGLRPGWYGRLQLHGPGVHGLPHAAIPAGPTCRRLGSLGYANRPRLGWSPRFQPSAHPKCLPAYAVTPQEEGSGGSATAWNGT